MNIGNRKKRSNDEYIPEWEKKCNVEMLQCQYCMDFDRKKQWCTHYMDEYIQHLKNGKKMR